jgi:alkyl hydroperoxide reductase subunit AhpF
LAAAAGAAAAVILPGEHSHWRRQLNFGSQTLDTLAIENYISVKETDG